MRRQLSVNRKTRVSDLLVGDVVDFDFEHRGTDRDLVAITKSAVIDSLPVNQCPVGALEVRELQGVPND